MPCALCNCVMLVKNVSDEGFFLVCSRLRLSSNVGPRGPRCVLTYGNKSHNWNICAAWMELDSRLMDGMGGHLQLVQGNSQPRRQEGGRETGREGQVERGHYGYSPGLLPMDKAFVFT